MITLIVIIGLSLLIFVHEFGHFIAAKLNGVKVEEFGFGFPPRIFSRKIGETVYSLNVLPFGGFVKIFGEDAGKPITEPQSFTGQPIWRRSVIVLSGVIMNVILALVLLSMVFMIGSPSHLMVSEVAKDSPAAIAQLKSGDIILEAKWESLLLSDPVKSEALISLVKESRGSEVILKIGRGKEIFEVNIAGRLNPPAGQGPLGVNLVEIGFPAEPFFGAVGKAFSTTFSALKLITVSFINFFAKVFVTPAVLESVAGPVGIFMLAGQAGSMGLVYFLELLALISLNLTVLNLIPFPALDGGRFLFLIFEKIKGSPISYRFQIALNTVGFVILIALMVLVTIQDIGKIAN